MAATLRYFTFQSVAAGSAFLDSQTASTPGADKLNLGVLAITNDGSGVGATFGSTEIQGVTKLTTLTGVGGITIDAGSQRIANVANLTGASPGTDAANKNYVDTVAAGLDWKASARVGITTNLANPTTAPGAAIDGVTMVAGDRFLLMGQTAPAENGIYVWTNATSAARSSDGVAGILTSGAAVFVAEGTNDNKAYVLTTNDPITVGTTGQVWAQFLGTGAIVAGNTGITVTGNAISNAMSVGLAVPVGGELTVSGTPLTTAGGTITLAWNAAVTQKYVFAAPNAANGTPAFRALISTDLPVVGIAQGGTGQATQTLGYDALNPNTTAGDVTYRGASNNVRLAGNATATKMFLNMTSAVPTWSALTPTDIGLNTNTLTFQNTAGAASGSVYNGTGALVIGPTTLGVVKLAGDTMTGKLTTAAGNATTSGGVQLTSGTVKTTPVVGDNGAIEWDGTALSIINSTAARKVVSFTDHTHTGIASVATSFPATVGTGGVNKGDALYVSAGAGGPGTPGTVNRGSANPATLGQSVIIGVASTSQSAAASVDVMTTGVLVSAGAGWTAGQQIFMADAGGLTNNPATGISSRYRTIMVGTAVNATDLAVGVRDYGMKP
jgi:hypothetical protein